MKMKFPNSKRQPNSLLDRRHPCLGQHQPEAGLSGSLGQGGQVQGDTARRGTERRFLKIGAKKPARILCNFRRAEFGGKSVPRLKIRFYLPQRFLLSSLPCPRFPASLPSTLTPRISRPSWPRSLNLQLQSESPSKRFFFQMYSVSLPLFQVHQWFGGFPRPNGLCLHIGYNGDAKGGDNKTLEVS